MSAHTFLHLLKSKFDKTFKEKRLIFEVGKVSDAAAGAATEGTDTKAELDTLEEQEGEAKKEIEAVSKDGQGVEAEAAAKAAIKETAIDNALNPTTITEDQFKALFSEEGLEVKTEKETITVKINELTSGQMDRVMTFVTANPTLTKSIVKAVKEGQIKSEQLGVSARKMVLKGALEMDEGDLRKVIENLTNTKAGIAATISAAERNKPIMKILLQVVEEQRDIPKITENALSIIITTLGFEEAMETLKDNLTFDQKASLLNIEDSTITKKEKEPLFMELNKNKEKLNTNSLTNIINFGLSRDGTPEAIGTFIMGLSSVKDKISKIAKKEMFAYIIKNPEIHEQRIKDFVEIYYNTQEKIDLIQDTTLDEKIRNAIEATLRAEEKTQLEQKKIEQAKAKDTKEAGIESEFTKLSPEAKLKAAEFIVAKRIKFFMPKDSKSERHFIKRAWHLEEIGKCETKEAVKLRVYQFLLGIIKSDGSYVDNRNKVVNFKESNAKMIAEIKRLEELVLKEKVVDPQAEDTTAKPEAGSAKPAEADAAKPAVADAITGCESNMQMMINAAAADENYTTNVWNSFWGGYICERYNQTAFAGPMVKGSRVGWDYLYEAGRSYGAAEMWIDHLKVDNPVLPALSGTFYLYVNPSEWSEETCSPWTTGVWTKVASSSYSSNSTIASSFFYDTSLPPWHSEDLDPWPPANMAIHITRVTQQFYILYMSGISIIAQTNTGNARQG